MISDLVPPGLLCHMISGLLCHISSSNAIWPEASCALWSQASCGFYDLKPVMSHNTNPLCHMVSILLCHMISGLLCHIISRNDISEASCAIWSQISCAITFQASFWSSLPTLITIVPPPLTHTQLGWDTVIQQMQKLRSSLLWTQGYQRFLPLSLEVVRIQLLVLCLLLGALPLDSVLYFNFLI